MHGPGDEADELRGNELQAADDTEVYIVPSTGRQRKDEDEMI